MGGGGNKLSCKPELRQIPEASFTDVHFKEQPSKQHFCCAAQCISEEHPDMSVKHCDWLFVGTGHNDDGAHSSIIDESAITIDASATVLTLSEASKIKLK